MAENGVYNTGSITSTITSSGKYSMASISYGSLLSAASSLSLTVPNNFGYTYKPSDFSLLYNKASSEVDLSEYDIFIISYWFQSNGIIYLINFYKSSGNSAMFTPVSRDDGLWFPSGYGWYDRSVTHPQAVMRFDGVEYLPVNHNSFIHSNTSFGGQTWSLVPALNFNSTGCGTSNLGLVESDSNTTGLSGTDTLGKDVVDLTLDQILQKLKDWAQDWYDAGADSATNAATGAKDLPLTVATGAATANPSIAEDGPLVWFPSFGLPIPSLRTGETDTNTVDQGKENANTADKTEAAAGTVEETQTIVDSLLNWASDYISPDKGLFSKFPLCIPYDAYLLVCSALGVDALGVDDVVGSSPGDVQSVMGSGVEVYSNFHPVINFKHELKAGGTTYPIAFTLDLSPFEPIVKLNRIFVTVYVLAELIASEYKRIRSS